MLSHSGSLLGCHCQSLPPRYFERFLQPLMGHPDCGTAYTLRSDVFARDFRYSFMTILPPPIRRKTKDCLTPVPPLWGSTGGNEESVGGSLRRMRPDPEKTRIRPHLHPATREKDNNLGCGCNIPCPCTTFFPIEIFKDVPHPSHNHRNQFIPAPAAVKDFACESPSIRDVDLTVFLPMSLPGAGPW